MKFTCDSCSAHYMISDEKVGPNGVKVRCKKCGHIVLVRRPSADALSPLVAPSAAPAAGEPGLDAELGQAFEAMMGESQRPPPGEPVGEELEPTQVVPPEELARFAAASVALAAGANGAAALAAEPIEWY